MDVIFGSIGDLSDWKRNQGNLNGHSGIAMTVKTFFSDYDLYKFPEIDF